MADDPETETQTAETVAVTAVADAAVQIPPEVPEVPEVPEPAPPAPTVHDVAKALLANAKQNAFKDALKAAYELIAQEDQYRARFILDIKVPDYL